MKLFKRCKHEFLPLANTHGDWINHTGFRTMLLCPHCGKVKYVEDYIEAPLDFGSIWNYYELKKHLGADIAYEWVKDTIFKDEKLFINTWGKYRNNIGVIKECLEMN